jgi:hypothetical protein
MTTNVIHFPKIIRHQGHDIDLDKIVRIKPTFYGADMSGSISTTVSSNITIPTAACTRPCRRTGSRNRGLLIDHAPETFSNVT